MNRLIKVYEKFIEKGLQRINEEWFPTSPFFFPLKYKENGPSVLPIYGYIFEVRKYRNYATGLYCITGSNYKKEPVSDLLFILEMEGFEMSRSTFYMSSDNLVTDKEGSDKYLIFTHVDDVAAPAFKGIGYIPQNAGPDFDAEYGRKMYKLNRPFRIKVVG